jgi:hypothetical protein
MSYKIGSRFKILYAGSDSEIYILCKPETDKLSLINIRTGMRWDKSVIYLGSNFFISEDVICSLFNFGEADWKEVFTLIQ